MTELSKNSKRERTSLRERKSIFGEDKKKGISL